MLQGMLPRQPLRLILRLRRKEQLRRALLQRKCAAPLGCNPQGHRKHRQTQRGFQGVLRQKCANVF